jgi:hypothetical protein
VKELVVCDPPTPASLVAEAELFAAPPGRLAPLILDLSSADTEAAAVVRDLADAPSERSTGGATVITLDPPLARAWRAHPAGRGR